MGAIAGEALPTLKGLNLEINPIGAAGQAALAATIRGGGLAGPPQGDISSPSAELQAACEGRGIRVR